MKPSNGRADSPWTSPCPRTIGVSGGREQAGARRVLLVASSLAGAKPIMQRLREEGWDVVRYRTVREGLRALDPNTAGQTPFDVVLWDQTRGLPADGPARCRALTATSLLPLLVLCSPHHTASDRVSLLNAGADGVVRTPPAAWPEVFAELRVLTRRRPELARPPIDAEDWIRVGPLRLSMARREARLDGVALSLTLREFDLLHYLALNQGRAVTRAMALDAVWGVDAPVSPAAVDVYVGYLRRKLNPVGSRIAIHTVRGVGYTLKAPPPRAVGR